MPKLGAAGPVALALGNEEHGFAPEVAWFARGW